MTDSTSHPSQVEPANVQTTQNKPVVNPVLETKGSSKLPKFILIGIIVVFFISLCVVLFLFTIIALDPASKIDDNTTTETIRSTIAPTLANFEFTYPFENTIGWSSFDYTFPTGDFRVSGIAPANLNVNTQLANTSQLESSLAFTFYDNLQNNIILKLNITEAQYYYYGETFAKTIAESSPTIYKEKIGNEITYTDSYLSSGCENLVLIEETPVSDLNQTCGTGTMFNNGFMLSCSIEDSESLAESMCDEFVKNLKVTYQE